MRGRGGFTLVETITAILLLFLVLGAGWDVTAATARSAVALADRGESLATARTVGWVLQEELEGVEAGRDVSTPTGNSFSIRAFRGAGIACAQTSPDEVVVRWSGVREPDPSKDSLLIMTAEGEWMARSLRGRSASHGVCPIGATGVEERWRLSEPVHSAELVRFFERGSYHLADQAFRYQIGAGGRQPLTPPNLDPARSGISAGAGGRLLLDVATLGTHRGSRGPSWQRAFPLPGSWASP